MTVKQTKFFSFPPVIFPVLISFTVSGQNAQSGNVMNSANGIAEGINKMGNDAKAKYAENIDNPYVPVRMKEEYTPASAKELLTTVLKKYVNYYSAHAAAYALKYYEQDLANFKLLAMKYQTLSEKNAMGPEQRKFIVQGNLMNEQLNYSDAIVYYDKAMAIDPVSYPAGYNNFALIAAMAERYELAILNMKKYLLLIPDAPDAEAAQDKIYEWETLSNRN